MTLGLKIIGAWKVTNTSDRKCCRCLHSPLAQYYQDKNEMGYMYVMEHVKTVISNSGSVLFLDNTSDTSRATGIN